MPVIIIQGDLINKETCFKKKVLLIYSSCFTSKSGRNLIYEKSNHKRYVYSGYHPDIS